MSKDFLPISTPRRRAGIALTSALVLGAGGSARAVVFGLIERGFKRIHVANRTLERAQALRAQFGDAVAPARWSDIPALLPGAGLLVNTTSLGMRGQPPLDIDIAAVAGSDAVVADLVYVPLVTPLLQRRAHARLAHGGWPRNAAVSGGARLFAVVRRAARR